MKVFIDTSAFISYFLKRDILHKEAIEKFNFYKSQNAIFLTSSFIIDELFTWFCTKKNRFDLEKVINAISDMEETRAIKVFYIDKFICGKAKDILIKFSEHRISFTDATTYVLYKDFAIDEVFTLDSDFKKMRLKTSF